MKFYLKAKVEDGELVILNRDRVRDFFQSHEGKQFEITVKKLETTVTAGWLRWYWGIVINTIIHEVVKQDGKEYSPDEVHAFNISKIVKPRIHTREILGETIVETTKFSLKDLPMKKWIWFKTEVQKFYAERGIDIPDPHEENFMNDERRIDSITEFTPKDSSTD